MTDKMRVNDNVVVTLDYTLRLDDGQIVDTSTERGPIEFLQGQGQIVRGLEKELYGMRIGDEKAVVVAPAEGYGEANPSEIEWIPRSAFPVDLKLAEGMALQMRDQESGQVFPAYIAEVKAEQVLLDFNHPLAGETLYFEVKVVGLRDATSTELAHGHAHSPDDSH